MKKTMILSFLFFALVLTGCEKNTTALVPVDAYEPLIPLKVGNYWLYLGYNLNSDGSGGIPDLWKFGFIIQYPPKQSSGTLDANIYQISRCGEDIKPFDDTGTNLYAGNKLIAQDEHGVYYSGIVRRDTIIMTFSDLIFPDPVEKGESVSGHVFYYNNAGNTSNIPDNATTQYVCVSTDSLFATPLGDFTCIVYKMAWQDIKPLFRDEVYYFI